MIEDSKMEKKINGRSVQLQPKTQVSDCKKSVDTLANKPWLRQGKKREVSNVPNKNDVRKAVVQKGRSFDKRPKPRGAYNNNAVGGTEDTGLNEYEEAEFGSVFVQGSKKQNLNHLLNFRVAPRNNVQWQTGPRSAKPRQNHIYALVHSNVHRHNKELFLQSNCQFVVRADGDYSVHLVDPDRPVNWDAIEMIIMHTPDGVLTCPICLCESQAARVTRCGHAYCWACVLHYLALADPPGPRPCPVCSQYIDAQYLKSVQSMPQLFTNVGEIMEMRLMRRLRNSIIVEPAPDRKDSDRDGNGLSTKNGLLSLSNMTSSTQYAKLLTADRNEVLNIIQRECRELHFQLENEIDTSEVVYIEQALSLLEAREKSIDEAFRNVQPKLPDIPLADVSPPFVYEENKSTRVDNFIDWFDVTGMDDVENGVESSLLKSNDEKNDDKLAMLNQSETLLNSQNSYSFDDEQETEQLYNELEKMSLEEDNSKYYYFYQAADGQLVFLSGINQRMLYSSWGDEENKGPAGLARAPTTISGKILYRLSGSVSTETRKRLKWLSHLPLHCPFDIVELDMTVPAVTQEALDEFRDELVERALNRERAERAERRRAQRCGRQLRRQAGAARGRPAPAPPSLAESHWAPLSPAQDQLPGPSPPQYNGPSFAKMASASGVWTVRPCAPVSETSALPGTSNVTHSEDDSDCPHASSSYTMDLSEAISAALKNTSSADSASSGKKKKKQKPKLLFSSGI